jgi:benzodiazapine receptor
MKWTRLVIAILICQMAGIIGSLATFSEITDWYLKIQRPSFTPPNWLFGPVWLTLYTLMGISLFWIWEKGLKENKKAIYIFGAQLFLNALWSFLFFGFHFLFYSLIEIIIMWITIALNIFSFFKISRKAGLILIPYIAWVSIALTLNYYVWILNP